MVKEDIEPRDNVPISNRFNGAKFPGVLLVALRAPSLLGPEGDVDTGPHVARVSAPPGKVTWTPQPAEPVGTSIRRNDSFRLLTGAALPKPKPHSVYFIKPI